MMIDTHCHVYASEMENAEEIIVQAAENDIVMIVNGTDPQSNMEVLELAARHENVYAALGYFYSFADEITDEHISLLDSKGLNVIEEIVYEIEKPFHIYDNWWFKFYFRD